MHRVIGRREPPALAQPGGASIFGYHTGEFCDEVFVVRSVDHDRYAEPACESFNSGTFRAPYRGRLLAEKLANAAALTVD